MNIELTIVGQTKFNNWVSKVGKPNLNLQSVAFEALDRFSEDLSNGHDSTYELGQQFTTTGRPEVFLLEKADYTISFDGAEND